MMECLFDYSVYIFGSNNANSQFDIPLLVMFIIHSQFEVIE